MKTENFGQILLIGIGIKPFKPISTDFPFFFLGNGSFGKTVKMAFESATYGKK